MKKVQIHRFVGEPSKKTGCWQATVLIGEGANRRSVTCHPHREGGILVGNNPDPTTIRRRDQAARVLANASATYERIAGEITLFEKLLKRELTEKELETFRLQGVSTEVQAKVTVKEKVIPTLKIQLFSARKAVEKAQAFQAEVNAAYPLTVEFVGI
ncbi:MAG: hypothetical protein Q8Q89_04960 [bacterium]|nr:hypothetical protein [bacterium]